MQQDNACPILYAHTRRDRREAKWVRLNAHLEDVAARAAGFARKFGAEDHWWLERGWRSGGGRW
jgi:hypothetical protein